MTMKDSKSTLTYFGRGGDYDITIYFRYNSRKEQSVYFQNKNFNRGTFKNDSNLIAQMNKMNTAFDQGQHKVILGIEK